MRKILLLILVSTTLMSCGGYQQIKTTNVSVPPIEEVINLEGSKNDLYVRANKWMVENFNNAKSVIQFSDKEAGVVAGKYLIGTVGSMGTGLASSYVGPTKDVFAVITIDVKDNAAKITLTSEPFQTMESKQLVNYGLTEESLKAQLNDLVTSFENYMKTTSSAF